MADSPQTSARVERGAFRLRDFASEEMNFQLARSLDAASFGGASLGEVLAAAGAVEDGRPASWVAAFAALAERVEADGRVRQERGHGASARASLLRASAYHRAAEYYGDPRDPATWARGKRSRACFTDYLALSPWRSDSRLLPFEGGTLPVHFIAPAGESGSRPTLLIMSGYDGTAEECYFHCGHAALERGWNVLLFDGPGQTGFRRFAPESVLRPHFESAVQAVVDHALARPEVDPARLALYGISLGGYFATRGAAFEPRVKALVANSPVVDIHAYLLAMMGFDPEAMPEDLPLDAIPEVPDEALSPELKLATVNLCVRYGRPSLAAVGRHLREFDVTGELGRIRCPVLGLAGADEGAETLRQMEVFARSVAGPVTTRVFTREEGAAGHCQFGNLALSAAVVCDWLEETLG